MTEAALIVNALAIICGFINMPVLMYVLFGFVWTAFFSIYEKLTWLWYEKVLRNETNEVLVNVKIAHIVELIIVMVSVYVLAYLKKTELCAVMPTIQMLAVHSIKLYKQRTNRNIIIFFCIVIELIFAIYFARQYMQA